MGSEAGRWVSRASQEKKTLFCLPKDWHPHDHATLGPQLVPALKRISNNGLPCKGSRHLVVHCHSFRLDPRKLRQFIRHALQSSQLSPIPTSTTSGTSSVTAVVISRSTKTRSASSSPGGASKTSSSCTCS